MRSVTGPTGHTLIIPDSPPPALIIDPDAERAEKLLKFYRHHNIQHRYKLLFKEFAAKVNAGTWNAYLADGGAQ